MNHQLKHTTDIETRDFISDERRFQMEENKMLGVFLVFIYLDNVLNVQSRLLKYSNVEFLHQNFRKH